jgi:hypothetical protein
MFQLSWTFRRRAFEAVSLTGGSHCFRLNAKETAPALGDTEAVFRGCVRAADTIRKLVIPETVPLNSDLIYKREFGPVPLLACFDHVA